MKRVLFLLLICNTAMAQKKSTVPDSVLVFNNRIPKFSSMPVIGSISRRDTFECWFKFVVIKDNTPIELWEKGYAVIPYRIQRVPNFSMFLVHEEKGEPSAFLNSNKCQYKGKVLHWIEK